MVSKALATAFLALLSFDTAGAVLCIYCTRVATDNGCYTTQTTCNAGSNNYCYSRIILSGGRVNRVDRGCSRECHTMMKLSSDYEEHMLCCESEFCNNHEFWKK